MNIPGLAEQLYGITIERAHQLHVCIDCKKEATWYSPAGAKEYRISGLCEPCFDRITGGIEEDTMGTKGSDVGGTINNDHALYAEEFLIEEGYDSKWQVVVADDKTLMLDYDQRPYDCTLPEQFYDTLRILEQALHEAQFFTVHESKGGNTHAKVVLTSPMPIVERIAWQAAFGSDPKREALHLLSVSRGELNPILLFMRKPEEQKLLGDGNAV